MNDTSDEATLWQALEWLANDLDRLSDEGILDDTEVRRHLDAWLGADQDLRSFLDQARTDIIHNRCGTQLIQVLINLLVLSLAGDRNTALAILAKTGTGPLP